MSKFGAMISSSPWTSAAFFWAFVGRYAPAAISAGLAGLRDLAGFRGIFAAQRMNYND